jgi:hypothetical protein
MSLIANLDVNVRADISNFDKGMQGGVAGVGKFKQAVDDKVGGVGAAFSKLGNVSGFGGAIGGILGKLQSFAGGIGGSIKDVGTWTSSLFSGTGALSALGMGLGVTAGAFLAVAAGGVAFIGMLNGMASGGANSIKSLDRLAKEIGFSTEAMAAFTAGSGIEADGFGHAMIHMQRSVQEMGTEAMRAFATLQIDPSALQGANAEQQLQMIAQGFAGLTSQGDRATVALSLFGRGGIEMMEMLGRGGAGLDAMRDRAERFGLTFSQQQADTVRSSLRSWGQWSLAMEGTSRQLAVMFAPAWEAIGNFGGWVGEQIVGGLQAAQPIVAGFWGVLSAGGTAIAEIWDMASNALNDFLGPATANWGDFRDAMLRGLITVEYAFKNWKNILLQGLAELQLAWSKMQRDMFGDTSAALAKDIDLIEARIRRLRNEFTSGLQPFLEQRMRELMDRGSAAARTALGTAGDTAAARTDHGAAERGSQAAYTLLTRGQANQEVYQRQIADTQQRIEQIQRDQLAELRRSPPIRRGRL